ncbi:MAG: hypothetical protein AAB320_09070 [Elusimicrobiota bacterium]
MDFDLVLKRLLETFQGLDTRYALIGGVAMAALGAPRATMDLDFMVHRDDMEALHRSLEPLGFHRFHHTENVSQYEGSSPEWGSIDFIHAFRELAVEMLGRAVIKPVFDGSQALKVLTPEDVIGLKVQAMANNPPRKLHEMRDIEMLACACRVDLDWNRVEKFYSLFGMQPEFGMLKASVDRG